MNKKVLRSHMARYGDNNLTLGKALGKSQQAVSGKLNSKRKFTLNEIKIISERYNLSMDDVHEIFFA